jgi:hypothetical protein
MNTYQVMMLMPRLAAAGGSPRARGSRPQYAARRQRPGWARRHDENMALQLTVSYRPPLWDSRGREGSLQVPAGCPLLIIEGDGPGRFEHP